MGRRFSQAEHERTGRDAQKLATIDLHFFDRSSLDYIGTFTGESTADTDGIAWTSLPFPGFPSGALFAVHDDSAVSAFDWSIISSALNLDCLSLENWRQEAEGIIVGQGVPGD